MTIFCRLCAEAKDAPEIVTSINDPGRLVEQKLIACCQWNPQDTDLELPQDVCEQCFYKLENSWSFLQSVHKAQRKIQNLFDTEVEPTNRSKSKPSKTKFDCVVCENTFSSRLALEKHDCDSVVQDLKCNICHRSFKTIDGFQSHCQKQGKHKCDSCLQLFCTSKALASHKDGNCEHSTEIIDEVETKPTFIDCNSAGELIADKEASGEELIDETIEETKPELDAEMEVVTVRAIDFDMAPIEIQVNMEENLNLDEDSDSGRRIRNSFPKDDTNREYYCYLCNRRFKKFPLLRYHMAVHALPRKYKCQYCNSRFRTERHYTSHQQKHVDYYCDVCNKKFQSAFALKVHKRMHVGAAVKMYGCEECDHFFIDVSTFYNHMRRRHGLDTAAAKKKAKLIQPNGSAKPYVCEQCGKDFKERSSLKAHKVVHLDVRPFQCDVCFKAFKNKYNLKTHQETHSGEKSVQCTECGKKYSRKNILLKHMEEHTGVFTRTFKCPFCDRIFRSLYNMENHRRTHTGEKPYRCDVCNHDVTTKSQLDRHCKTISHINKLNESMGADNRQNYM